jgi:hypothetical protein
MDDAYAGGAGRDRMGKRNLAPAEQDPATIGPISSAEDLDQSRLACAVLAAEGVNLAPGASKGHVVERADAGKGLRYVDHLKGERLLQQS